jgi:hypothetical protein
LLIAHLPKLLNVNKTKQNSSYPGKELPKER